MVLGNLVNTEKYNALHPRFAKAFEAIKQLDFATLEVGKYEIDGKDIFYLVSAKEGGKIEGAKFEAHDNYIDIQICPEGTEKLGWKPRHKCVEPVDAYNPEKDVTFFKDQPDTYFDLHAGDFAIFFPEDVHAPQIGEGIIKKIVIKVKI